MRRTFKKVVSVVFSIMLCATAVTTSFVAARVEFDFDANDKFSDSGGEFGTREIFADDPEARNESALDTSTNTVKLVVYTAATPVTSQKTVKLDLGGIPNSKVGSNIETATTVGAVTVTLKNS